ncbi:isochorismatase family cysteine hydrolase [Francisella sp. 19X1-34]|uniref:cysteine hydrolase family protein n=1 Tax=Francisella sp. 19X1-34 TaxID=3087177 RepID=UPI002E30ACED|nr:isochorismatase family cysteine hydrolase [Francisella sp. 19X1-34]MED7789688.1 isochorismatase family cysteine hydrolase [Francisella sp. 19X1-34]
MRLVIVADFINEIVHEDGAFGECNAQRIKDFHTIKNANKIIAWARKNDVKVAHVKMGFGKDYYECPKNSPILGQTPKHQVFQLGSWATDFHKDVDVQDHDIVITKHRISFVYATNCEAILRANKIENIIVFGVSTELVIESSVRELHDRDYKVTVISDACNAGSEEGHNKSLKSLAHISKVVTAEEFLSNN